MRAYRLGVLLMTENTTADLCRFWWGEFRCTKARHDETENHSLVWDGEEDEL